MTEFKIKVNPQESELLQKLMFLAGYSWITGETTVFRTDAPYLYKSQMGLKTGYNESFFNEDNSPEITFEQFLDMIETELNNKSTRISKKTW